MDWRPWFMVSRTLLAALVPWVIFLVSRSRDEGRGVQLAWGFLAGHARLLIDFRGRRAPE